MSLNTLNITIVQPDIIWEDADANLAQYERLINEHTAHKEVVILPEMFATGFSMQPEKLAEKMDGKSVSWMKKMAAQHRCIITGSLIIEEDGNFYNRLIWMQPDGNFGIYDKRHLFGYADEDLHYTNGNKRFIASVKGWKINLLICYDLRFPVWARQSSIPTESEQEKVPEYDVLVYVANWPERRRLAWKTLLQARAIENQSYVVGVNRVGTDGNDIVYSGDSSVFDALGNPLFQESKKVVVQTITLDKNELTNTRASLPFLKDADNFLLL